MPGIAWRVQGHGGLAAGSPAGPPLLAYRSASPQSISRRSSPCAPGWPATPDASADPEHSQAVPSVAAQRLQLLSPTALGGPADYFGDDNYWETLFSIGLVPLVLATSAPSSTPTAGWFAVGSCSPAWPSGSLADGICCFMPLAFRIVPGMSWFRVPARSLFLANLAGAVLAGLGVETLEKPLDLASPDWRKFAIRFAAVFVALLSASCS